MTIANTENYQLLIASADITNEFNIKIIILFLIFAYSVFGLWFSYKINDDEYWKQILKYLMLRIPSMIMLFYFPLNVLFLFRTVSVESLLILLFSYYSIFTTLVFLSFLAYGFSFISSLFGFKWKPIRFFKLNKN